MKSRRVPKRLGISAVASLALVFLTGAGPQPHFNYQLIYERAAAAIDQTATSYQLAQSWGFVNNAYALSLIYQGLEAMQLLAAEAAANPDDVNNDANIRAVYADVVKVWIKGRTARQLVCDKSGPEYCEVVSTRMAAVLKPVAESVRGIVAFGGENAAPPTFVDQETGKTFTVGRGADDLDQTL
jgi:hypothetical protein